MKGQGPPQHNIQLAPGEDSTQNIHRGPGPVKAVRNFGTDEPAPVKKPLKIKTKQQQERISRDSLDDTDDANRSFSYNKDLRDSSKVSLGGKEALSAGIKRTKFGTGEKLKSGEDPALLTQSSKIVYINTDDLDPL